MSPWDALGWMLVALVGMGLLVALWATAALLAAIVVAAFDGIREARRKKRRTHIRRAPTKPTGQSDPPGVKKMQAGYGVRPSPPADGVPDPPRSQQRARDVAVDWYPDSPRRKR